MAVYRSNVIIPRSSSVFAIVLCIKISNDSDLVVIPTLLSLPITIENSDVKYVLIDKVVSA